MMLAIPLALILADTTFMPERPATVSLKRAVPMLASPRSTWEQRIAAVEVLDDHVFTEAELDTLTKALPSLSRKPAGKCEERRDRPCEVELGPCMSPAAFVLQAIEGTNANDAFVEAALQASQPGVDSSAVALARRILAKARHESVEAIGLTLLEGDYSCVQEATMLLTHVTTLGEAGRRALTSAIDHPTDNQRAVGALIASREEPWAKALQLRCLAHPDTGLRLSAVRAAAVETLDPELRAAMARVARCDPLARLQRELKERFTAAKVELPEVKCLPPAEAWTVEGRALRSDAGVVVLGTSSSLPPANDACLAHTKGFEANTPLGMLGNRCLVALNLGEWGGGLSTFPGTDGGLALFVRGSFLNPRAVVKRGDELLVLSSSNHGFGSSGVGKLITSADGGLRYEPMMRWNGSLLAWATTQDTLFVTLAAGEFTAPCAAARDGEITSRFSTDGGWSPVRGAATKCLWP